MSNIATYLNDHLAGSVAALEMLDHLVESPPRPDLDGFFVHLRSEIQEAQDVLRHLIDELGVGESSIRKASAWLGEKFSRAKLHPSETDPVGIFLSMEMLLLGLTGQAALWRAMACLAPEHEILQRYDFPALNDRAQQLAEHVEDLRLQLTRESFFSD